MKIYTWYSDPGHAWLKVPASELETLGIKGLVSQFSYANGNSYYLEEDCDAPLFLEALKAKGITDIDFREINEPTGNSPVRAMTRIMQIRQLG